jgi:hypothetical protein
MRRRILPTNAPCAPVLRLTQARIESDIIAREVIYLAHVLVGEPVPTPDQVRGKLSPEHAPGERRMARKRTAFLILMFVVATAGADRAARAEDCLAGPNAQSPQGRHWYYRIDRATKRKCWYLGDLKRNHAGAKQTNRSRRSVAPPPEPVDEAEAAPTGTIEGPRAEPERVASATPVAPMGARPVPTERVRNEPAPARPPEPAKPPAAAPAVAAPAAAPAGEARGGLAAALLGIALLLAVVGTILVLARRRVMQRIHVAPSREESATQASGRPRRSLREILAQAEPAGSPDEREARYPGSPHFAPLMRATEAPDIAAATLQPAIAPLASEAPGSKSPGVEPAPDVEQSLRRLLDAWERRAA